MKTPREFIKDNNPALAAGLFFVEKNRAAFTLVEIMIVVAIISLLVGIALPGFMQYKRDTQSGLCQNHLRLINHAKSVWAAKGSWTTGDPVDENEVNRYIRGGAKACPSAGVYIYNVIDTDPACSIGGDHAI